MEKAIEPALVVITSTEARLVPFVLGVVLPDFTFILHSYILVFVVKHKRVLYACPNMHAVSDVTNRTSNPSSVP